MEDITSIWAFAIDTSRPLSVHQHIGAPAPRRYLQRYQITACSREARAIGISNGMDLRSARDLAPKLRVLVCNR
jgi:nucleotidyltransferase/DNA polymerase involved in DNA repair